MQPIRSGQIVTPAAAVARRQARPLSVSAGRAAPRRRFHAYLVAYRFAYLVQRFSRHGIGIACQRLGMIDGRREMHLRWIAVGVVQQPAGCLDRWRGVGRSCFGGIAPAFVFFCRSSRSSRPSQCLQGIRWNVCRNVCRSSRSSGPATSGDQVIKPHCPPRAVHRQKRDRRASGVRRFAPILIAHRSRSLWGSRPPPPVRRAPA